MAGPLYMWWTAVVGRMMNPMAGLLYTYVVDSSSWEDDESYGRTPVYVVDSSSWEDDESYGRTPVYVVDSSCWEDDESYIWQDSCICGGQQSLGG